MLTEWRVYSNNGSPNLTEPQGVCFLPGSGKRTAQNDGLLSQWRGYGKDGGYALVFDSQKLEEALKDEKH